MVGWDATGGSEMSEFDGLLIMVCKWGGGGGKNRDVGVDVSEGGFWKIFIKNVGSKKKLIVGGRIEKILKRTCFGTRSV